MFEPNLISGINIFSALLFFGAACLLIVRRRQTKLVAGAFYPLLASICLYGFVTFSNSLEHSGITSFFDTGEDIAEIIFLPMCLFALNNLYAQRLIDTSREKEQWLQVTFDSLPDGVMCTDSEGKVLMVNRAMETLAGVRRETLQGADAADFMRFRDEKSGREITYDPFVNALTGKDGKKPRGRLQLESSDGSLAPVAEETSVISDANGMLLGAVGLFRNMAEYDAMNEQLLHVRKMEALGQLAGGVAHDLNNMLGGIIGAAELLQVKLKAEAAEEGGDNSQDLAGLILKASSRASELTLNLLDFSRKGKIISTPIVLQDTISNTLAIAERAIDKKIKLQSRLPDDPLWVIGDPAQLQNCFLNLLINAKDAMPRGGELVISATAEELSAQRCHSSSFDLHPGAYACVRVIDQGDGIPENLQQKIFEPYVTTKDKGEGTGLGLAAVHGIVSGHHGAIELDSVQGKGSTFSIFLPLTDQVASEEEVPAKMERQKSSAGTVLIIEDEAVIRVTMEMMLESSGYRVLSASSGEAGIALFVRFANDVSLVILDMVLPGISGREIFQQLKRIDPKVRVVVTSGFPERKNDMEGTFGFIQKPYRQEELIWVVETAIGDSRAGSPA